MMDFFITKSLLPTE